MHYFPTTRAALHSRTKANAERRTGSDPPPLALAIPIGVHDLPVTGSRNTRRARRWSSKSKSPSAVPDSASKL